MNKLVVVFLEKGILAQYHNFLQCLQPKYLQLRHTNISKCSDANIWLEYVQNFGTNITFTKKRLSGVSVCQGELFHPANIIPIISELRVI